MMSDPAHALAPVIVPDASVAAKWYFEDEGDTAQAHAILQAFQQASTDLVVPDCFFYELTSLIRRAERRQPPRLGPDKADRVFADMVALPIPSVESRPYLLEAVAHSRTLDVSIYDALYLAVAEHAGATFVTADRKLYDRVQNLPHVRWLGDLWIA